MACGVGRKYIGGWLSIAVHMDDNMFAVVSDVGSNKYACLIKSSIELCSPGFPLVS